MCLFSLLRNRYEKNQMFVAYNTVVSYVKHNSYLSDITHTVANYKS